MCPRLTSPAASSPPATPLRDLVARYRVLHLRAHGQHPRGLARHAVGAAIVAPRHIEHRPPAKPFRKRSLGRREVAGPHALSQPQPEKPEAVHRSCPA